MQEMIKERLMILANAQSKLAEASNRLDRMEKSIVNMERCSFDLLNKSDKLLSLSNATLLLVDKLKGIMTGVDLDSVIDRDIIAAIIDDIRSSIQSIYNTCIETNRSSHEIESEVICQRENKEFINDTLEVICSSISSAVACAEMLLAQY